MVSRIVVVIVSKMLHYCIVYWQMELPIVGMADVEVMCSSVVMNYYVYDRYYVTENQNVVWLILLWWFLMLENNHVCDSFCVTGAKIFCGCLFKLEFWWVNQHLILYDYIVGICLSFYSCMGHWHWWECLLWLIWQCFVPPSYNVEVVHWCFMTWSGVIDMDGWEGLHVSFKYFWRCSDRVYNTFIFIVHAAMVFLSLGFTRRSLMVLPPLQYISMPFLLQMLLKLLHGPSVLGITMWKFLLLYVSFFLMLLESSVGLLGLLYLMMCPAEGPDGALASW